MMINQQFAQGLIQHHATGELSAPSSSSHWTKVSKTPTFQNLITYELHRCKSSGGFGFDLKGDRPAVIGSVRKSSIADQAGLQEGDLVISINNKKVTELDHDQVVRLVGLSKSKLILQVTKLYTESYHRVEARKQIKTSKSAKQTHGKNTVSSSGNKKLKHNGEVQSAVLIKANVPPPPPCPPPFLHKHSTKYQENDLKIIEYSNDGGNNFLDENIETDEHININNTKTTEEEEDDESDYDYDLYLMTGRRRRRHHKKLNLTDNTNFTGDSSQTGDSMPSINMPNMSPKRALMMATGATAVAHRNNKNYENAEELVNAYDEYDNQIGTGGEEDDENSDDFFDYEDDLTGDTVSTEDTEDNSSNVYNDFKSASGKKSKLASKNQLVAKSRSSRNYPSQHRSNSHGQIHHHIGLNHNHQHYHLHQKNLHKKSSRLRAVDNQEQYARQKRNLIKANQYQSPVKPRIKPCSKPLKSVQNSLPPPVLTSTFQLQANTENYVNMPLSKARNVSIESDVDEQVIDHQKYIRQQRKQQHIMYQQELAYTKHINYTNKLEPSCLNGVVQNSYQNMNYNIDYQNLENLKSMSSNQKNYVLSTDGQQHLKHIENVVYKQHNNMSATNIGLQGSATNIGEYGNELTNSATDPSIRHTASITANLQNAYIQKISNKNRNSHYFDGMDENIRTNDKFSINSTTSDTSQNINNTNISQNENIQPIKPFLIKQNMNINMSKIANIKHFNITNSNLQNIIKSSSSRPGFESTTVKTNTNPLVRQTNSCVSLGSQPSSIKKLNVNDLYAILKPVIKPYIYDNCSEIVNRPIELDMLFVGELKIAYDTLCNASKLNSIRKSIEYFLVQDRAENYQNVFVENHMSPTPLSRTASSSNNVLVNFMIDTECIRIENMSRKSAHSLFFSSNLKNEDRDSCVYDKSQIAFCGRIKESFQFFALVLLPQAGQIINEDDDGKKSSCCLVFRYIQSSAVPNISLETILNDIAYIYRYQDCVFNTNFNDFSKSEAPQQQQQAPLQNVANSPRIFGDESKNKEIIKTNMNYMSMNASQEKVNYNDGIILNKQTNDIYFKRINENSTKNSPELLFAQQQQLNQQLSRINRKKSRNDRLGVSIDSSSCSSTNNASNLSHASTNRSTTSPNKATNDSFTNNQKLKLTSLTKPTKETLKLKSEAKKPSSSSLDMNNRLIKNPAGKIISNSTHKNFKSSSLTSSTLLKTINNSEKKFQRNSEHTQSIKLIKENLANLFLSKKGLKSGSSCGESNASSSSNLNIDNNDSRTLSNVRSVDVADDDLLRAIEFETNKNHQQAKSSSKSSSKVHASSSSMSLGSSDIPAKISLTNRLSARFSHSKPKKSSSSHTAFQFLHRSSKQTSEEKSENNEFICEEEDFFDADHFINSIDLVPSSVTTKPKNSRLSLPSNGNPNVVASHKPSTSKRLFGLISGSHGKQQNNQAALQAQSDNLNAFQSNQQRRLSDFHRPTKAD